MLRFFSVLCQVIPQLKNSRQGLSRHGVFLKSVSDILYSKFVIDRANEGSTGSSSQEGCAGVFEAAATSVNVLLSPVFPRITM